MTTKTTKPTPEAAVKTVVAPKAAKKPAAAPKVMAKSMATVTVKQTGSPLRRESKQKLHLLSLGLGKMNRVRTLQDTPSVRGLVHKVQHMVTVLS